MTTATQTGDELVASAVPDANKALYIGHLLYATEIRVATLREKFGARTYPPRIREKYKERLARRNFTAVTRYVETSSQDTEEPTNG
ncbi:MAG: hypothetical protein JWO67_4027 [Streptosporangiaceae bacterium]|nr:hypothetical protein [Streptosporangiaceae bacterium]